MGWGPRLPWKLGNEASKGGTYLVWTLTDSQSHKARGLLTNRRRLRLCTPGRVHRREGNAKAPRRGPQSARPQRPVSMPLAGSFSPASPSRGAQAEPVAKSTAKPAPVPATTPQDEGRTSWPPRLKFRQWPPLASPSSARPPWQLQPADDAQPSGNLAQTRSIHRRGRPSVTLETAWLHPLTIAPGAKALCSAHARRENWRMRSELRKYWLRFSFLEYLRGCIGKHITSDCLCPLMILLDFFPYPGGTKFSFFIFKIHWHY